MSMNYRSGPHNFYISTHKKLRNIGIILKFDPPLTIEKSKFVFEFGLLWFTLWYTYSKYYN